MFLFEDHMAQACDQVGMVLDGLESTFKLRTIGWLEIRLLRNPLRGWGNCVPPGVDYGAAGSGGMTHSICLFTLHRQWAPSEALPCYKFGLSLSIPLTQWSLEHQTERGHIC